MAVAAGTLKQRVNLVPADLPGSTAARADDAKLLRRLGIGRAGGADAGWFGRPRSITVTSD